MFWCVLTSGGKNESTNTVSLKAALFIVSTFLKKGWWRDVSLHFFHYAKFQFACSEINVQVKQRNKLAYNLHLEKKKISNSVPTLILNIKYKQIITWCFSFLLHFRYRYKQCDIQTSKFTAMSTSLIDFTSLFLEAPYPTASRWVSPSSLNWMDIKCFSTSTILSQRPHLRFGNQQNLLDTVILKVATKK